MPGPVSRFTTIGALVMLLAGCTLSEINRMEDNARKSGNKASNIAERRTALTQPPLTWTDKPWVNLSPVAAVVSTQEEKALPACSVTLNRPEGLSLPELGQRITALCGMRVVITPDAFANVAGVMSGVTQQMTGTLPAPEDNGRVPLAQIGGQPGQATPVASASTPMLTALKWQGDLKGLLDLAASRLGLSWRVDNHAVVFYQMETRTYQLVILNTRVSTSASVTSGSSSTIGTSGTTTGGVSGDSTSSQTTNVDLSSDLYEDIKKTVESMVTPTKGRFWLSSASGTLTVTDTPETLDRIGRYIDYQNRVLNRQVQLNVQVYSVTLDRKEQFGLDWDLIHKTLNGVGASLSGNFMGASENAGNAGISILENATGRAGKFAGSQLLLKALSQQGNVSMVTQLNRATTNLTPVPFQISDQTGYIESSGTTSTANVGTTATMQTGIITTGLFMTMLPFIQENGDVQLQFAFSLSDKPVITPFISEDGNTRNDVPTYRLRSLTQKVNLRSGQTLMLTGADQIDTVTNKQGTFTPGNFLFGGGRDGVQTRTTLVIIITPILLR